MGWVPESQRTTIWYLFNKLFYVRVNPTKIRTIEEIKAFGTPTTGNEAYDREMIKAEEVVMLNIAQMEDLFNNGYPVNIVRYDDTKEIYKLVTDHLFQMRDTLAFSENATNDPKTLDELVRLDKFAAGMFDHARHTLKQDVAHSSLANRMMNGRFSGLSKLGRRRSDAPLEQKPESLVGTQRDYRTGEDFQPDPTKEPDTLTEKVVDPNLPQRLSLERLFEERKRMGLGMGLLD